MYRCLSSPTRARNADFQDEHEEPRDIQRVRDPDGACWLMDRHQRRQDRQGWALLHFRDVDETEGGSSPLHPEDDARVLRKEEDSCTPGREGKEEERTDQEGETVQR